MTDHDDHLLADPDTLPDVDRIRAGLALLAADTPPAARRRVPLATLAAAAAVIAVAVTGVGVGLSRAGSRPVARPTPSATAEPTGGPVLGVPAPSRDLATMVHDATRIVVGRVTAVRTGSLGAPGESGGDGYVLATVEVEEAIKSADATTSLVAFAYAPATGVVTSEGAVRPWHVGDRVLLFLTPDVGTASSDIEPEHLFVDGGESGRYLFSGDRLDAPFTLDDVRRAVS